MKAKSEKKTSKGKSKGEEGQDAKDLEAALILSMLAESRPHPANESDSTESTSPKEKSKSGKTKKLSVACEKLNLEKLKSPILSSKGKDKKQTTSKGKRKYKRAGQKESAKTPPSEPSEMVLDLYNQPPLTSAIDLSKDAFHPKTPGKKGPAKRKKVYELLDVQDPSISTSSQPQFNKSGQIATSIPSSSCVQTQPIHTSVLPITVSHAVARPPFSVVASKAPLTAQQLASPSVIQPRELNFGGKREEVGRQNANDKSRTLIIDALKRRLRTDSGPRSPKEQEAFIPPQLNHYSGVKASHVTIDGQYQFPPPLATQKSTEASTPTTGFDLLSAASKKAQEQLSSGLEQTDQRLPIKKRRLCNSNSPSPVPKETVTKSDLSQNSLKQPQMLPPKIYISRTATGAIRISRTASVDNAKTTTHFVPSRGSSRANSRGPSPVNVSRFIHSSGPSPAGSRASSPRVIALPNNRVTSPIVIQPESVNLEKVATHLRELKEGVSRDELAKAKQLEQTRNPVVQEMKEELSKIPSDNGNLFYKIKYANNVPGVAGQSDSPPCTSVKKDDHENEDKSTNSETSSAVDCKEKSESEIKEEDKNEEESESTSPKDSSGDDPNHVPNRLAVDPIKSLMLLSECRRSVAPDEDGDLPLHIAVVQGHIDACKRLLLLMKELTVHPDQYNNLRQTPLHLAVITGQSAIVHILLFMGTNPCLTDRRGNNCIHLAIIHQQYDCLDVLLQVSGVRINMDVKNYEGFTALHIAVERNDSKMVRMLLAAGAEVNVLDGKCGRTPLFYAAELNAVQPAKELIQNGGNINLPNFAGSSPFQVAHSRGFVTLARALSDHGAVPGKAEEKNTKSPSGKGIKE